MDPIRTAVKYSLIPLRIVVELGDRFVSSGESSDSEAAAPAARRRSQPRQRRAAAKSTRARTTRPGPQASNRPKDLDDVALARKVETIIFRDRSVPKGDIDVNAAGGVVWLRGEARTPDMIKTLERQTKAIPEVRQVENLLHLPKTPAPTRTDTPSTQRRTRSTTKQATPPEERPVMTGVTEERSPVPPPAEESSEVTTGVTEERSPSPVGGGSESDSPVPPGGP